MAAGLDVVLHARRPDRAAALWQRLPSVTIVTGDLSSRAQTLDVARQIGELGAVDAVIHNAGLFVGPIALTEADLPAIFAVNVLRPVPADPL